MKREIKKLSLKEQKKNIGPHSARTLQAVSYLIALQWAEEMKEKNISPKKALLSINISIEPPEVSDDWAAFDFLSQADHCPSITWSEPQDD